MRGNRLWTAAVLLAAACGSGDRNAAVGANGVAANEAVAEPAAVPAREPAARPAPAPGQPPPQPEDEGSIPKAFHGVYDASAEACGRPGDGRLEVSAGELRFHESVGSVRGVAMQPSGAIRVEADHSGEGERWRSSRELRLSREGSKLTVSGEGSSMDRVRCPAGTP